jgi:hypothetical protein
MKLEDFISESITQIISGVAKAQEYAAQNQASINPITLQQAKSSGDSYFDSRTLRPAQVIDFDISVTTKEDGKASGKAGVFVSVLKFGVEGSEGTESQVSNRIKFSVPIILPIQKV